MALILTGAACAIALMFVLWLVHFRLHNAAIVDAGWAGGLALIAAIDASGGGGWGPRRVLIGAMACAWGLRLAIHLLRTRVLGHKEEGRYVELRRSWRTGIGWKFLLFFEAQAVLCVILGAPFYLAATNPSPEFGAAEIAGAVVWMGAIAGEAIADRQLTVFKRSPESRGATCRQGLWRYSRHPNYFFEWVIWVAFSLVALPAPYGWLGVISPALILFFLLCVTGIPATEAQAVRSKGDDYREYQRTTSPFVPWFPK